MHPLITCQRQIHLDFYAPPRILGIAAENNLHPVQVTQWKGQVLESATGVFERRWDRAVQAQEEEKEKARLERKVGQLVVEVDWLKKKCEELGIDP